VLNTIFSISSSACLNTFKLKPRRAWGSRGVMVPFWRSVSVFLCMNEGKMTDLVTSIGIGTNEVNTY
jgi:hypothetical protein